MVQILKSSGRIDYHVADGKCSGLNDPEMYSAIFLVLYVPLEHCQYPMKKESIFSPFHI